MYYPNRLCILLGSNCNLSCKYCFRDLNRSEINIELTDKFSKYISTLPSKTYAVIFSGGEPLIYFDTMKRIIDLLPNHCHKKIITNGLLLTNDIVSYINENDIEVNISHDGRYTKYLRGYDVFDNPRLLNLIKSINNLVISSVITSLNTDIMEVKSYISNRLSQDFYLFQSLIIPTKYNKELYKNFNIKLYNKSLLEYSSNFNIPSEWYHKSNKSKLGFNYLLNGDIVNIHTLKKYGTVYDSSSKLINNFYKTEDISFCKNYDCKVRQYCQVDYNIANDFTCNVINNLDLYRRNYDSF